MVGTTFFVLYGILGETNKGLGKAQKAARGRSMKARPTQSRKGVKGGLRPFSSAPCRVKGQRPLWGLGQRPNSSTGDQYAKRAQQRCRQRSVPASNFARPQTRPQAALPPRFREEPKKTRQEADFFSPLPRVNISLLLLQIRRHHIPCVPVVSHLRPRFARGEHNHR